MLSVLKRYCLQTAFVLWNIKLKNAPMEASIELITLFLWLIIGIIGENERRKRQKKKKIFAFMSFNCIQSACFTKLRSIL